jgi:hypothetical protein
MEYVSVLDDFIKSSELIKSFVNKELNGQMTAIFWCMALIKGDFETRALLLNNFSPFCTRDDYEFLNEKYSRKKSVRERLKKLEN